MLLDHPVGPSRLTAQEVGTDYWEAQLLSWISVSADEKEIFVNNVGIWVGILKE